MKIFRVLIVSILAFIAMLNVCFGQSVVVRWESEAETTLLQVKNPRGKVSEYKVDNKFFSIPVPMPGDYFWRIKSISGEEASEFTDWAQVRVIDSILDYKTPLMTAPENNAVVAYQTEAAEVTFTFDRPNKEWDYFVEMYQDQKKILDKKIDLSSFKLVFPKSVKEITWRISGRSKFGNYTRPDEMWKLNLKHTPPIKRFKVSASGKQGKAIISWPTQQNCPSYKIFIDESLYRETTETFYTVPMSTKKNVIKVECSSNKYQFGQIAIKKRKSSKKKIASQPKFRTRFYYQLSFSKFTIGQDLANEEIDPSTFENSYNLQSHLIGTELHWGKDFKYALSPYIKYSKTLSFSDEISILGFGGLFKYSPFRDKEKKLLAEFNQMRIEYAFLPEAVLAQTISFFGLGYESPVKVISPKLSLSGFVKFAASTTTPSFEMKSSYSYNPKLQFHFTGVQSVSDFKSVTNGEANDAQTKIMQLEFGATYFFK